MWLLQAALLLYLTGAFPGGLLASGLPLRRRDLFPIRESPLDMALTSFDDQYKGCAAMMAAELEELNRTEFAHNRVYAEAWQEASSKWDERKATLVPPGGLEPEYAIALTAYTIQGRFHRDFNAAVREAGRTRDFYLQHFQFKAFHFLLTRALRALRSTSEPRCQKVYRGVRGVRFASQRQKQVRFGHFTSSSLKNESALQFGKDTFFTIETCHGVNIKDFSFFPGEDEVLIPPFEMFKVVNFTKAPDTTFIHLLSLEDSSVYNCAFVKERRCKTQRCNFSTDGSVTRWSASLQAPVLLWAFLLFSGGLGAPEFL
ncbi:erythroblast NAD(P)(+)--arginine ADP-ribosyltransferase-like [Paroedura picta]|uniref:erythroblast NAD(P)(+)--arginine ADP-ribosyltransferase-like n=1 Tax=Paroedura picta TaxID=143630 RepID=UPI004056B8D9